ncbi:MAG: sulfotransferase family protein [Nocardioides sp.]|nr:sulfotransferase family protein [Nocardioides sp.]
MAETGHQRRVVFVVGSGRSGTSTMAVALRTLGLHVPQPEVPADDTNPKGFGEPQWAVDLHTELLRRANVQVSDARPSAWFDAGRLNTDDEVRERLATWLEHQFGQVTPLKGQSRAHGQELVVKDPRMAWFLGLWRSAAQRAQAVPAYVTMLRPVTEVVGSKQRYYAGRTGPTHADEVARTAAWVNMMLHTERSTRDQQRAFVRYADLLSDWTVPIHDLGRRFELATLRDATTNDVRAVHSFIDPGLRRVQLSWDDVDVPPALRVIAEETWEALDSLADEGGDSGSEAASAHATLDQLRTAYGDLYEDAEAMAQSTALAQRRAGRAEGRAEGRAHQAPGSSGSSGSSVADRVPHGVRAMVPPGVRQGLRRALGRQR